MKLPHCKNPCKNCPFKKDTLDGWLGEERMTEILDSNSFVCHENNKKQCAGFMIIKKDESEYVILANQLNIDLGLIDNGIIFENKKDCIKHHKI